MIEPQLPWLLTVIHVHHRPRCKKRKSRNAQDAFLQIPGFNNCAGVTRSGCNMDMSCACNTDDKILKLSSLLVVQSVPSPLQPSSKLPLLCMLNSKTMQCSDQFYSRDSMTMHFQLHQCANDK